MKRDMDLIRKILLEIESHEHGDAPQNFSVEGYSKETVGYHVHLLGEAHLLEVTHSTVYGDRSPQAIPLNMTWDGHDFLDACRDENIWNRAKSEIGERVSSVSFGVLKQVLVKIGTDVVLNGI